MDGKCSVQGRIHSASSKTLSPGKPRHARAAPFLHRHGRVIAVLRDSLIKAIHVIYALDSKKE